MPGLYYYFIFIKKINKTFFEQYLFKTHEDIEIWSVRHTVCSKANCDIYVEIPHFSQDKEL